LKYNSIVIYLHNNFVMFTQWYIYQWISLLIPTFFLNVVRQWNISLILGQLLIIIKSLLMDSEFIICLKTISINVISIIHEICWQLLSMLFLLSYIWTMIWTTIYMDIYIYLYIYLFGGIFIGTYIYIYWTMILYVCIWTNDFICFVDNDCH